MVLMTSKKTFPNTLKEFAKEIGVPTALIVDPSGKETSREVKHFARECSVTLCVLKQSIHWENLTKNYIGLIRQVIRKDLAESDAPLILWDYCVE